MTRYRWFPLIVAAALPCPAAADWAYTHWGMSPEQVAAASGGSVKILDAAEQAKNHPDDWVLAARGNYTDGALSLDVGFTFDTKTNGLKCVMYDVTGSDVAVLKASLTSRYGKPASSGSYGPVNMQSWKTPDHVELTVNDAPAAVVTHCRPGDD